MGKTPIAVTAIAAALSLSAAGMIGAAPANASRYQAGDYDSSWVNLNRLCDRNDQGWYAYQQVNADPNTWRCADGGLIPFNRVNAPLDDIVAVRDWNGWFSNDPERSFVIINGRGGAHGYYDGQFYNC